MLKHIHNYVSDTRPWNDLTKPSHKWINSISLPEACSTLIIFPADSSCGWEIKKKNLRIRNIYLHVLKMRKYFLAVPFPLLRIKKDSEARSSCSATCQKDREEGEEE